MVTNLPPSQGDDQCHYQMPGDYNILKSVLTAASNASCEGLSPFHRLLDLEACMYLAISSFNLSRCKKPRSYSSPWEEIYVGLATYH